MVPIPSNPRRPWQPLVLLATVAVAAGALLTARSGRVEPDGSSSTEPRDPESAVAALLAAERDGQVDAYRAHLTGPLLQEFESRLQATSVARVAAELRSGLTDLKGHATTELSWPAPDRALLVVELVFADRRERRQLELRERDGLWRISRRMDIGSVTPAIPYGTPVVPSSAAPREH